MVLVGDPKQSIYAFRGGDIDTYLAAARTAEHHADADPELAHRRTAGRRPAGAARRAGPGQPGDPGPAGDRRTPRDPGWSAPRPDSRCGCGCSAGTTSDLGRNAKIPIDRARKFVARDLTADIAELLGSGATFDGEPVEAKDIAVIVGTHAQAQPGAGQTSSAAGIPAVVSGNVSVFHTQAGDDWLVLLEALEQPHRSGRVRAAALTPFVGRTAAELAAGGDTLTDELSALFSRWATVFTARGVAALLEVTATEQDMPARMLGRVDGERRLTDLRHVGQALHAAALDEGLGLSALTDWLRRRRADTKAEITTDRIRRLDTDAAATQVVTLHASKGLQYPVVYLPFAFDRYVRTPDTLLLHENGRAGAGHRRARHPGPRGAGAPGAGRGCRRGAAASVCRADPGPVAGRHLVGADQQHHLLRAAPGAVRPAGRRPVRCRTRCRCPPTTSPPANCGRCEQRGGLVVEKAAVGGAPAGGRRRRCPTTPSPSGISTADWTAGGAGCRTRRCRRPVRRARTVRCRPAPGSISGDRRGRQRAGDRRSGRTRRSRRSGRPPVATMTRCWRCRRRWPTCRSAPPSAPWCTPCWRPPIRRPPICSAELRARSAEQIARRGADLHRRAAGAGAAAGAAHPARPARRRRRRCADIPVRDRLPEMDFEIPLAGGDDGGGSPTETTLASRWAQLRR